MAKSFSWTILILTRYYNARDHVCIFNLSMQFVNGDKDAFVEFYAPCKSKELCMKQLD